MNGCRIGSLLTFVNVIVTVISSSSQHDVVGNDARNRLSTTSGPTQGARDGSYRLDGRATDFFGYAVAVDGSTLTRHRLPVDANLVRSADEQPRPAAADGHVGRDEDRRVVRADKDAPSARLSRRAPPAAYPRAAPP